MCHSQLLLAFVLVGNGANAARLHNRSFWKDDVDVETGHEHLDLHGPRHVDFMPSHNMVVCACAKCGSTSLYAFLYEQEFNKTWPYHGRPFLQQTESPRWEHRFEVIHEEARRDEVMESAWSFALVRDPKERLISAWKSKVACDEMATGVDTKDRLSIMPELHRLRGGEGDSPACMSFDEYVSTLHDIHKAGKTEELNIHFLPQDHHCFQNIPASRWSRISTIDDTEGINDLLRHMGRIDSVLPNVYHQSNNATKFEMYGTTRVLLEEITASEYAMFGHIFQDSRGTESGGVPDTESLRSVVSPHPATEGAQEGAQEGESAPSVQPEIPMPDAQLQADRLFQEMSNDIFRPMDALTAEGAAAGTEEASMNSTFQMPEATVATSSQNESVAADTQIAASEALEGGSTTESADLRQPEPKAAEETPSAANVAAAASTRNVPDASDAQMSPSASAAPGMQADGDGRFNADEAAAMADDASAEAREAVVETAPEKQTEQAAEATVQAPSASEIPSSGADGSTDLSSTESAAVRTQVIPSEAPAGGAAKTIGFTAEPASADSETAASVVMEERPPAASLAATALTNDMPDDSGAQAAPSGSETSAPTAAGSTESSLTEAAGVETGVAFESPLSGTAEATALPSATVSVDPQNPASKVSAAASELEASSMRSASAVPPAQAEASRLATAANQAPPGATDVQAPMEAKLLPNPSLELASAEAASEVDGPTTPENPVELLRLQNLAVCATNGCGAPSLFDLIHRRVFDRGYPGPDWTRVRSTTEPFWEGRWDILKMPEERQQVLTQAHSMAFVCDPKDRWISVWKNQLSCTEEEIAKLQDPTFNVTRDGPLNLAKGALIKELRTLQGRKAIVGMCLTFEEFVQSLYMVHTKGRRAKLNEMLLPQDLACFGSTPVASWDSVHDLQDHSAFRDVSEYFTGVQQDPPKDIPLARLPKRPEPRWMSAKTIRQLNEITAPEYEAFGDRLLSRQQGDVATFVDGSHGTRGPGAPISAFDDSGHEASGQGLTYSASRNFVVCSCSKCGSTSLHRFLYQQEFGHEWPFTGRPLLQALSSNRWGHRFALLNDTAAMDLAMARAYSFALIRDPKERLISAWKSKVACSEAGTGVDEEDRAHMVPELRALLDRTLDVECLSFREFVGHLYWIHKLGRARFLNPHFLPQDLGCFRRYPPSAWTDVVEIGELNAFKGLTEHVYNRTGRGGIEVDHKSMPVLMQMTPKVREMLDYITTGEYAMLRDYLMKRPE